MIQTKSPEPHVLLAIPVYNEERYVDSVLTEVQKRIKDILVIDDGSTDQTVKVASDNAPPGCRVLRLVTNRGKGAAIRTGVLASRGDHVLLCDADLATPITDLERLDRRPASNLVAAIDGVNGHHAR